MKKIDIYTKGIKNTIGFITWGNTWQYECSTLSSDTCKKAKEKFCLKYGLDNTQVKCNFAK